MKTHSDAAGLSRRSFVRRACCAAVGTTGMLNALAQLRAIGATASAGTDYRALVCLYQNGGNDGTNMIVPTDATSYAAYAASRAELAIPQASLLSIAPKTYSDGRSWGLHPSMPEMQSLFGQGRGAIVANVGSLVQPTTLADYVNGVGLPPQLFSHIDQLTQWQSSIPDQPFQTGWGGRVADIVNAVNTNPKVSMSISMAGINSFQRGNTVSQLSIGSTGALQPVTLPDNSPGALTAVVNGMYGGNNPTPTNLLEAALGTVMVASQNDNNSLGAALQSAPTLQTVFPSTAIGTQMQNIARLISVAPALNLRRQMFFALLNGWDLHAGQLAAHGPLLAELSAALNAFYAATVELGVANQVTTFTGSDFGRTYIPNADGTDHGWGGHHLVVGGAVRGGDIYGSMPSLEVSGPDDTGRGRWIPSTSVDEYSATMASWFGVGSADLSTAFPNIGRFATSNLGFMATS